MRDIILESAPQPGWLPGSSQNNCKNKRFYWSGYQQDIEKWVRACQSCQKRNPPQPVPKAPMGTNTAHYPFERIS